MSEVRKQGKPIRALPPVAIVIGDYSVTSTPILTHQGSHLQKLAGERRKAARRPENNAGRRFEPNNKRVFCQGEVFFLLTSPLMDDPLYK